MPLKREILTHWQAACYFFFVWMTSPSFLVGGDSYLRGFTKTNLAYLGIRDFNGSWNSVHGMSQEGPACEASAVSACTAWLVHRRYYSKCYSKDQMSSLALFTFVHSVEPSRQTPPLSGAQWMDVPPMDTFRESLINELLKVDLPLPCLIF